MQLDKELDEIVMGKNKKQRQQKKMKDKLVDQQQEELKMAYNFLSKIGVFLIFGILLIFTIFYSQKSEMAQKLDDNKNELKIVDDFDDYQVLDPGNITTFKSDES